VLDSRYQVADLSEIYSPGLVVFRDLVEQNLAGMVHVAGSADRLRPHCKTHKMLAVVALEQQQGITRHKAATIAEAEMLAEAGVRDIFLAYNVVGPNISRAVRFVETYPEVKLAVTADHAVPLAQLSAAMAAAGRSIEVLLDVDTGLHRTGMPLDRDAFELYRQIGSSPGLVPGGLHLYDGHNHQKEIAERRAAVMAVWEPAARFRDELVAAGLAVPRIVAGGTASFPIFATLDDPAIELSPGTTIFHDYGYGDAFPDLVFQPAALLLTRVISRPTPSRITLDLGYKAVASENPLTNRVRFPELPDAKAILQNEEHLVIETSEAGRFTPGDALFAIPKHICPTTALHQQAYVISGGKLVDRWPVVARDRVLKI
jgi:D-serine deaminase-like pyridoxal phosphate-dependent protein